jgi:hypothetical protein
MRWNAEAALMVAGATAGRGDTEALRERCEAQARAWGMASVQPATVVRVAQEVEKERSAMGMATAGRRIEVRRTRGGAKRRVAVTVAGMALALAIASGVDASGVNAVPGPTPGGVYRAYACGPVKGLDGQPVEVCALAYRVDDDAAIDAAVNALPAGVCDESGACAVTVTVEWMEPKG